MAETGWERRFDDKLRFPMAAFFGRLAMPAPRYSPKGTEPSLLPSLFGTWTSHLR
jgi:hypothetical protein